MMRTRGPAEFVDGRSGEAHPRRRGEDAVRAGSATGAAKPARRCERFDTRLRCWCEGEEITYYARMANLGEGGVFVRTAVPLAVGERAVVRFAPRGGPQLAAPARVVWTRTDGMGLRFDPLDEGALEAIRGIVDNEVR